MAVDMKAIHVSLETLHTQFGLLNEENVRVWGIVAEMKQKLTELTTSKVPGKKPARKTRRKPAKKVLEASPQNGSKRVKRTISEAGRKALSEGAKKRWDKYRQEHASQ